MTVAGGEFDGRRIMMKMMMNNEDNDENDIDNEDNVYDFD